MPFSGVQQDFRSPRPPVAYLLQQVVLGSASVQLHTT